MKQQEKKVKYKNSNWGSEKAAVFENNVRSQKFHNW